MNIPESPVRALPRWPVWVLLGMCVVFLATLIFGVKPWDLDIAIRAAAGEKIPLTEFIQEGFWWSSCANFVLCGLLLASSGWWLQSITPSTSSPRGSYPVWFCLILLAIVLGAALIRAPRLTHSLWNDEEYSFRRYVFGSFDEKEDGTLKIKQVDWANTFFNNRNSNNHVLFSVAKKASLKVWDVMFPNDERHFSEAALRFPAYIAGLLGITVVGLLMASLGRPMLGLMAAFFLTLHPWHLRYSVEARGYAFLLLFASLAVLFLMKAVQRGGWGHWLLFAGSQFAFMISFGAAVYFAAALNLCALAAIFVLHKENRGRLLFTTRLLVANVVSVMAFLVVMGPSIHQIRINLERDTLKGGMGMSWIMDLWSHMASGVRLNVVEPDVPLAIGLNMMIESNPILSVLFYWVLPLLTLLGLARCFRLGPVAVLAVIPFFLGAVFSFLHNSMTGNYLHSWYLIFLMPGLALAVFLGIDMITAWVRRPELRNSTQAGLGFVFLLSFFLATLQPRFLIRTQDRQPLRQAAEATRGTEAYSPASINEILTVSLGTSCRQLQSYDPRIVPLDKDPAQNLRDFERQMEDADARNIPLFVTYANVDEIRGEDPEILRLLEDPEKFEHVKTVYGLEEMFTFLVVRYLPRGS